MNLFRTCALGVAATTITAAGAVVLSAGAASAVTCPAIARGTGTVTPAPSPGVNWSACNLEHADLAGADLAGADLMGTNLEFVNAQGANLSDVNLQDGVIDDAQFADVNLSGTEMSGIYTVVGLSSGGITGTPASLPHPELGAVSLVDGYLVGPDVDLDNANLAAADLAGVSFQEASLVDADLAAADLSGDSIDGNLAGANLGGVNLAGAYLGGVSSGGITGTPAALPSNWLLEDGYLIGPDAQVVGANLTGLDLAGADLQYTDLDESNLTDVDLAGADLANGGLLSATLTGANLSGADLYRIVSGSITGTPEALPQSWTLRDGYLFGPDDWLDMADLSGLDLSGLDLADAFMESANLTGANMSGTDAAGADLGGAQVADVNITGTVLAGASLQAIRSGGGMTGAPASLPAGWVLRSGWLIGPAVFLDNDNLNGVNLSGTDMAGANVSFSTFDGADLSGTDLAGSFLGPADFTNANLAGADLFGADMNPVTWTGATCPDGSSASSHGGSCASALAFRFAGFIAPKPGSTIKAAARDVLVHFKLATTSGAAVFASIGAALGAARDVRATLAGPRIKATTAYCSWVSFAKEFACRITDPRGIEKGKEHSYSITVAELPQSSFVTAPRLGKAANPETVHFK
jgi:uncharacterized protein YjbI with pentapeptide repeats